MSIWLKYQKIYLKCVVDSHVELATKTILESRVIFPGSSCPPLTADRVHCTTAIPESQGEWFLAEKFDTKYVG